MLYKRNQIITAKVKEIDLEKGILVELSDGISGFVPAHHIGNIQESNIINYFSRFEHYKFKVINNYFQNDEILYLSYKLCHPHLITNKNKIIATANNFRNLKKALQIDIDEYDFKLDNTIA